MGTSTESTLFLINTILSGSAGAVLAVVITQMMQKMSTKRQRKLECLRRVVAFRNCLMDSAENKPENTNSSEFFAGLNEIGVTFNDSPRVIRECERFRDLRSSENNTIKEDPNESLYKLVYEMMKSLSLDTRNLPKEHFLKPFSK